MLIVGVALERRDLGLLFYPNPNTCETIGAWTNQSGFFAGQSKCRKEEGLGLG